MATVEFPEPAPYRAPNAAFLEAISNRNIAERIFSSLVWLDDAAMLIRTSKAAYRAFVPYLYLDEVKWDFITRGHPPILTLDNIMNERALIYTYPELVQSLTIEDATRRSLWEMPPGIDWSIPNEFNALPVLPFLKHLRITEHLGLKYGADFVQRSSWLDGIYLETLYLDSPQFLKAYKLTDRLEKLILTNSDLEYDEGYKVAPSFFANFPSLKYLDLTNAQFTTRSVAAALLPELQTLILRHPLEFGFAAAFAPHLINLTLEDVPQDAAVKLLGMCKQLVLLELQCSDDCVSVRVLDAVLGTSSTLQRLWLGEMAWDTQGEKCTDVVSFCPQIEMWSEDWTRSYPEFKAKYETPYHMKPTELARLLDGLPHLEVLCVPSKVPWHQKELAPIEIDEHGVVPGGGGWRHFVEDPRDGSRVYVHSQSELINAGLRLYPQLLRLRRLWIEDRDVGWMNEFDLNSLKLGVVTAMWDVAVSTGMSVALKELMVGKWRNWYDILHDSWNDWVLPAPQSTSKVVEEDGYESDEESVFDSDDRSDVASSVGVAREDDRTEPLDPPREVTWEGKIYPFGRDGWESYYWTRDHPADQFND